MEHKIEKVAGTTVNGEAIKQFQVVLGCELFPLKPIDPLQYLGGFYYEFAWLVYM